MLQMAFLAPTLGSESQSFNNICLVHAPICAPVYVPSFLFTTGNAWNMTESECNALDEIDSNQLQRTLRCIVWLLLSSHFLLFPLMLFSPLYNLECMKHDRK